GAGTPRAPRPPPRDRTARRRRAAHPATRRPASRSPARRWSCDRSRLRLRRAARRAVMALRALTGLRALRARQLGVREDALRRRRNARQLFDRQAERVRVADERARAEAREAGGRE